MGMSLGLDQLLLSGGRGGGTGPSLLSQAQDTFTRANTAPGAGLGTASAGGLWVPDSSNGLMAVVSNTCVMETQASATYSQQNIDCGVAARTSGISVTLSTINFGILYFYVRYNPITGDNLAIECHSDAHTYVVTRKVGGVSATLVTDSAHTSNTAHALLAAMNGLNVTITVDGDVIYTSAVQDAGQSGTFCGVGGFGSTSDMVGLSFDNLTNT